MGRPPGKEISTTTGMVETRYQWYHCLQSKIVASNSLPVSVGLPPDTSLKSLCRLTLPTPKTPKPTAAVQTHRHVRCITPPQCAEHWLCRPVLSGARVSSRYLMMNAGGGPPNKPVYR